MSDVPEHLKGAWITDPQTLDSQSLDVNLLTKEQLDALRAMSRCSQWRLLSDEQPNIGDTVLVFVKDMNPTHQVCEYFKESGLTPFFRTVESGFVLKYSPVEDVHWAHLLPNPE